jgi:hypothetical protein
MSYKQTLLPDYVNIVEATSISFYNSSTNILSAMGTYIAEINQCIEFAKANSSYDMLSSVGGLFATLNDANFTVPNFDAFGNPAGEKQLDDSFKLFFIEKYFAMSEQFQVRVQSAINNNVYFKQFSDDTGDIANTICVLDNNTSPYYDTYSKQYFLPVGISASLYNKISQNELKVLKTFSYYTDTLLKRGLSGLQVDVNVNTAKTAHGTNLVTDILYYNRAIVNQLQILNLLKSVLGDLSDFISFFKQINPKDLDPNRKAILFKFTLTDMEHLQVKVDAFKDEIVKIEKSTMEILS